MAVKLSKNLRLRIDSNLTSNAKYNLEQIDLLGSTFLVDSTNTLTVRSQTDLVLEPNSPDIGGSGVGGTVSIGTPSHILDSLAIYADELSISAALGLKDQAVGGTKDLKLEYKSDLNGPVDNTSDRVLRIDLSGADRDIVLGGSLSVLGGPVTLNLSGPTSLILPQTGTLSSLLGVETLENKTISALDNTISDLANANISSSAAIAYSKLALTGSIVGADIAIGAAIPYSKLSLVGSLVNADVSGSAAIAYSKLALSNSITNSDINSSAAIAYSKLNLATSIIDSDISTLAAISRSKIAAGTANGIVVNDGAGLLSSTPILDAARGGTGLNSTATFPSSGVVTTNAGTSTLTNKTIDGSQNTLQNIARASLAITGTLVNADLSNSAAVAYSKLALTNSIVNADVSSTAAIAGTKISPDFGNQKIRTTDILEFETGGYKTSLQPATSGQSSHVAFKLPADYGVNGQVLSTNGSGDLSWTNGGGGGGSGTVTSVGLSAPAEFTVSGSPITTSGTLTLTKANQASNLIYAGPASGGPAAPTFRSLAEADIPALTGYVEIAGDTMTGFLTLNADPTSGLHAATKDYVDNSVFTGNNNSMVGTDGSGALQSIPGFDINAKGGQQVSLAPFVDSGAYTLHQTITTLDAASNVNAANWRVRDNLVYIDPSLSGFNMGTSGQLLTADSINIYHEGTSDTGALSARSTYFQLGNGSDAITVDGISYVFGFGDILPNVTVDGGIQGYGFQPNISASATLTTNAYINAFYDFAIINTTIPGYTSFSASPTIANVANNSSYTSANFNPTITAFTGNAGYTGLGIAGTYGTMNINSTWNGIQINPTVTQARYAAGINISMDNVTAYPGVASSLVFQDITYTFTTPGDNNNIKVEYIAGATAGNETASITGGDTLTVVIDPGVSTATQVKAAVDTVIAPITSVITGVASSPQIVAGPTFFTGGVNAGVVRAADFDGDVNITGALNFSGDLSVGKLTAFKSEPLIDGGGTPSSTHTLITAPTVAANATIANADTLGVNTAALINIGANATVTTSFLGVSALGLPAVLTMGAGATVDRVGGAVFALSLDAGSGGGTVDSVSLCRSIAIPNGVTTVNNLYGYKFDLPFGDPGTATWGYYTGVATASNYFERNVLVGNDTETNSSVGIEINSTTKALLNARMTTTQRNALTAVNGMQIYNTTTNQTDVYQNGAWVPMGTGASGASFKTNWITADGASKTIVHNLGTTDVSVTLFDIDSGETVYAHTEIRTDINTLDLTASAAPAGSGYRVLIAVV
jgi:hypothetical protein